MSVVISKIALEQKLKETSALFGSTTEKEKQDILREDAYWLTQALENENPNDVLMRAFSFWEKSNGKTGLKPFELSTEETTKQEIPPRLPFLKGGSTPPVALTLWGMLDHAFQNGEYLDDRHVSDIFNRLPPATQTHFIDTVAEHIRASIQKTSYTASDIAPILKDEALLLGLVEKTTLTAKSKEEDLQRIARKLTDWLQYHKTEPPTEEKREEVLYGAEAANMYIKHKREETTEEILPLYELRVRDRLRLTTTEYLRIRPVSVEKLLAAVPTDPRQLALVAQSAVRQDLLAVPDAEFKKRVRTAMLIRAYSCNKELHSVSIRQFFRGVVEE
ncbi:MAG: hypothetical protein A3J54_02020 [Candidatus Ryanbacteria bacterium RIFCSPHIGHO2_02_FULL_45_13b]|uniref:Uncharacterized protein n=1 Tax=Candidatus Ryanbacteria bacterium RIFCSPHIGHO2_02_FULL_45_13b TaxID=1802117 RepID=A0A1G2G5V2_9BACT|nr:MAG: hypothetical protein A3J54_02020 [Candidatus Ryanbacteria bacterium RIFCSPHIGHO2_02_FULL_45_13b]